MEKRDRDYEGARKRFLSGIKALTEKTVNELVTLKEVEVFKRKKDRRYKYKRRKYRRTKKSWSQ